ncbi:4'-phosphopantetheinyl transferase family protein [Bacillus cereus]|uniref:4'-phosphopantetheinyl transferase family protein n=1 Tax=Bacillus cereus TaxID=1396 RepID=UPI00211D2312|nr:4'-phosphopantetheinyl transferase superfamily protein [Bacillus cereus]
MKEIEDLNLKVLTEKNDYFYDLWTLKESYIKAIGTGLSTPFNSFTIKKMKRKVLVLIKMKRIVLTFLNNII